MVNDDAFGPPLDRGWGSVFTVAVIVATAFVGADGIDYRDLTSDVPLQAFLVLFVLNFKLFHLCVKLAQVNPLLRTLDFMASRKKESEGIALLSMYNGEDGEEMGGIEEGDHQQTNKLEKNNNNKKKGNR
ncbi:hypothetical protein J1N35_007870 [Gossypium stocksii]|uniref:Uncharacterized protein n=1 Tax=Gossypium stocksii TaxID=47602 RepID=A0A9D4ADV6_9ROSI|nr:hypothetical protein J1N35_007870 [Gossypium stocksii]